MIFLFKLENTLVNVSFKYSKGNYEFILKLNLKIFMIINDFPNTSINLPKICSFGSGSHYFVAKVKTNIVFLGSFSVFDIAPT